MSGLNKRSTPDTMECQECFEVCGGPAPEAKVYAWDDAEDVVFCSDRCSLKNFLEREDKP